VKKYVKLFEEYTNNKPKAKFKIGDKVNYKPKMSGMPKNKVFEIDFVKWKDVDDLSDILDVEFKPTWYYGFKDSNLMAEEEDIKHVSKQYK